jgi:hypothetical protein
MPETNGISGAHRWGNCEADPAVCEVVWLVDVVERVTRRLLLEDDRVDELIRSLLLLSCWSTSSRIRLLGSRFRARKRGRFIESRRNKITFFFFFFFFSLFEIWREKKNALGYAHILLLLGDDWLKINMYIRIFAPAEFGRWMNEWTTQSLFFFLSFCIYAFRRRKDSRGDEDISFPFRTCYVVLLIMIEINLYPGGKRQIYIDVSSITFWTNLKRERKVIEIHDCMFFLLFIKYVCLCFLHTLDHMPRHHIFFFLFTTSNKR